MIGLEINGICSQTTIDGVGDRREVPPDELNVRARSVIMLRLANDLIPHYVRMIAYIPNQLANDAFCIKQIRRMSNVHNFTSPLEVTARISDAPRPFK
jgi:hypothetical protein